MSAAKLWQAGYRDLVSVIPPKAELAPTTKVKLDSRGKVPGRRRLDGRWTGYPFLTSPPGPQDIRQWTQWGANVGIHGAHFPGLDIDSEDAQLSAFLVQEALRFFGNAPVRTSRPPRRLLVYRTDAPFPRMRAIITYKGAEHVVELLGTGRQYLVHGQHPSGRDYGWEGRALWDWAPDSLTPIDADKVAAFFDHIAQRLAGRAEVSISASESADAEPPEQESLLAPSFERLRDVVESMPNNYPDRDTYIKVGIAIKAAAGAAHEGEAFALFLEWATRWEHGDNSPETVEHDWAGMHAPFYIGFPYLCGLASVPAVDPTEEFEADPEATAPLPSGFITVGQLLEKRFDAEPWIVDGILPAHGMSLLSSKPKVGKSTLARALAAAVVHGKEILGRAVRKGKVLYLHFVGEGGENDAQDSFRALGLEGGDLIYRYGAWYDGLYEDMADVMQQHRPILVIADVAQKLLRVPDMNDYAKVTTALEKWSKLFDDHGAHGLLLHHDRKGDSEDTIDRTSGSTALSGGMETIVSLTRNADGQRFMQTTQRNSARSIEVPRLVEIDNTGWPTLGNTTAEVARVHAEALVIRLLRDEDRPVERADILAGVEGRDSVTWAAVNSLVAQGYVQRSGRGKRGDPYTYELTGAADEFSAETDIAPEEIQ